MIHVLYQGKALCDMPGTPAEWPEGHSWVNVDQKRICSCKACFVVMDAHEVLKIGAHAVLVPRKSLLYAPNGR